MDETAAGGRVPAKLVKKMLGQRLQRLPGPSNRAFTMRDLLGECHDRAHEAPPLRQRV